MARVLSALVLLPVVIGTVWFLPPVGTLVLASLAAVLCVHEYGTIAAALGAPIPRLLVALAVLGACVSVGGGYLAAEIVLMSAVILFGALAVSAGAPGPSMLPAVAASVFPIAYLGLPLGALAAVRAFGGREAILLLMITIVISDSAQYYCGRAFGKRPLAPTISPKKTIEGALGGMLFGTLAMALGGRYVFDGTPWPMLLLVGACIAALGIVGDLFESLLKRSAGVKDSSHIIPGHGGVLDRIDSWLFAAPLYYVFIRYLRVP